jgi:membrane-associated phospholipid phosphatase
MTALLYLITNFGDLAVLLPVAGIIPLWLLAMRLPGIAFRWAVALALCLGGIAALKIFFYACPPLAELRSPSGHTGLSTLVYGALLLILASEGAGWRRVLIFIAGAMFIVLIGLSRVLLQAHSWLEAVLGLVVGMVALGVFAQAYIGRRTAPVALRPLVIVVALLVAVLHGQQLHAEELLHAIGVYLQVASFACA